MIGFPFLSYPENSKSVNISCIKQDYGINGINEVCHN